MKRQFLKLTAAAAVGAIVGGCGGTDSGDDVSPGTLIDVAFRSGVISALVPAARRAGLEAALSAPGAALTVLAPSNEAWGLLSGQLGFNSIQALIDALPVATLEAILRYHVLPTQLTREQIAAGGPSQPTLLTLNASNVPLALDFSNGGFAITDPVGRKALGNVFNIVADNGLFHVIDRVLLPAGLLTVLQTVLSNPERFGSLTGAIGGLPNVAGSVPPSVRATLNDASALTLFAPLNAAFTAAAATLAPLTTAQVETVLRHHVLAQRVLSSQISFGTPVTTLSGQTITILNNAVAPAIATIDDSSSTNANIVAVNILASNGVVHVVDKLLLPTL